jgi:hypothetical protein
MDSLKEELRNTSKDLYYTQYFFFATQGVDANNYGTQAVHDVPERGYQGKTEDTIHANA